MAKQRPEDHLLDPRQFPELNRQFFREQRGPHEFIHHRMRGLVLAASNNEAITGALNGGLTVGGLAMTGPIRPDSMTNEDLEHFAALEATILLHHAAETLVRLVLALEIAPPCPWIEVTALRHDFKRQVEGLASRSGNDETRDVLVRIFYGQDGQLACPTGIDADIWKDSVDGLVMLVRECTDRVLGEAPLYNSAKHGLSAIQGHAGMSLALTGLTLRSDDTPSLTVLESRKSGGRKKWFETTHWVHADYSLALTYVIAIGIENLWKTARARYVTRLDGDIVVPITATRMEEIRKAARTPREDSDDDRPYRFQVPSMSMDLIYFQPTPESDSKAASQATRNRRKRR